MKPICRRQICRLALLLKVAPHPNFTNLSILIADERSRIINLKDAEALPKGSPLASAL